MKSREFDPLNLDVAAFAKDRGQLSGVWPLRGLVRLVADVPTEVSPTDADEVQWSASGELREPKGGLPETWLHVQASAKVAQQCQRCLAPVVAVLGVDRAFRFVAGEDAAASLDAESEEDVLALTRSMSLQELVEDELLLELPLVPRHDVCPQPLVAPESLLDEPEAPHPFAALAALKRGGPTS